MVKNWGDCLNIAGGDTTEIEMMICLQEYAVSLTGKDAYHFTVLPDAFKVIPYTLTKNDGTNSTEVVTKL